MRRGRELAGCTDHATFFSGIVRIRAGDPVFGPLPIGAESLQGTTHGFIAQTPLAHALLPADLGRQRERPEAGGLAKRARGLMQNVL